MTKDVRLLPTVIGVGAILFVLKAAGVAFTATAAEPATAETAPPATTSAAASTPARIPSSPSTQDPIAAINAALPMPRPDPNARTSAEPIPSLPPELEGAGVTQAEMDVLSSLSDRRGALDGRERELQLQASLLAATEKRVNTRIAELKAMQARIQQLLDQRETMEKTQLDALVKVYSTMKPAEAARIFAQLDGAVRLAVAQRMKPDAMAGILAKMPPDQAQKLTVELATRLKLPDTPPVAPAPVSSAAPATVLQTVASLTAPAALMPSPAPAIAAPSAPVAPEIEAEVPATIPAPSQASLPANVPPMAAPPMTAPATQPAASPPRPARRHARAGHRRSAPRRSPVAIQAPSAPAAPQTATAQAPTVVAPTAPATAGPAATAGP